MPPDLPGDITDVILRDIMNDAPDPGDGPEPHRVLWFAVGTALWVTVAILAYCLGWLLVHG